MKRDPVIEWVGTLAVAFLALFLRLWDLAKPHSFEFDETYYAKDAWSLLHNGYARNYVETADSRILLGHLHGIYGKGAEMVVHPEVGKWMIALGESVFGFTPYGWRIVPAITGALMVLVMIRFARRVTGSTLLGLVAGLLMTFDGLQLVLSRLALIDIFVAFWSLCAVHCLVADRDWMRRRLAPIDSGWGPRLLWRPWLLASGVCWGLALGTKWSALYLLAAMGIMFWIWCAGARRAIGVRMPLAKAAILDALPGLGYLVLLPLIVYIATWTGWLIHSNDVAATLSDTQYGPYWGSYLKQHPTGSLGQTWQALQSLWHYHHDVYAFHTKFLNDSTHVYQSNPDGWLILSRPVGVDAQLDIKPGVAGCTAAAGSTCLRQVLLLGTPALWWFCSFAGLWSLVCWVLRRDWRYGLVCVGIAATWLPWFRYDSRPIFSYYAVMILPFLILGATMLLGEILGRARSGRRRVLGAAFAGAIVLVIALNFFYFWPIYTDQLITNADWLKRIWFKRWI